MLKLTFGTIRSISIRSTPIPRNIVSRHLAAAKIPIVYQRTYASSSKPDEVLEEAQRVSNVINVFRENPEIRSLLDDFQNLLAEKGLQPDGKQPSMFQMMKILADKDVKASLLKLKEALDGANIQLTQEDLNAFMNLYGLKK
mmetsp:Transcript_8610/g.8504  ORF Transcript_8610/g.8504 Transcript_8610/m.8504 type:complete len:142 (-) Transcript_8610:912-1337(-)